MTGSDDEWVYLDGDGEAEVTEEETGVADDGGSAGPAPAPADCASGDATECAADDDDFSEGCGRGSHCYTAASEDDGPSDEEAYSDDGPFGTTELVYDGAAASADVFVDAYPVGAVAYATSIERPDGAADNDASGNNDDCYYGYDGEVYQNYGYGHGRSYGYGDAAYLGGGYYSGYQYLAGYQRPAYQLFYVPGAGMYQQSPAPYVLAYPYAQPASPYGYGYVPYGYPPPPAPVIPYAEEPSAPPQA